MRILALILVALIVALQYPMWLGKGGWLQVRELGRQVERQKGINAELKARNDALEAEVHDLKHGVDAIEERARAEMGMVKRDEVFFLLQEPPGQPSRPGGSEEQVARGSSGSGPAGPSPTAR